MGPCRARTIGQFPPLAAFAAEEHLCSQAIEAKIGSVDVERFGNAGTVLRASDAEYTNGNPLRAMTYIAHRKDVDSRSSLCHVTLLRDGAR